MKRTFTIITAACLIGFNSLADVINSKSSYETKLNKVIDLYNAENYDESLSVLETVKFEREQNANWYYYYGLNKARLEQYQAAEKNLDIYVSKSKISDVARGYYYLGLVQFHLGEYEKALTSLQLSLDVSNDPALDKMTDALIDKTVRYQTYYENSKKLTITAQLLYNYDTNVLNLSQDSFTEKISGHPITYAASVAYKAVDKYSFIFEPALAVIDTYTFDDTFKANSTTQANDGLQMLLTLPIRFYMENEINPNKFDFSLNGYSIYLPISSSTRELALSSFFIQGQLTSFLNLKYSMRNSLILAADKGYGFSSDDDDATGLRFEYLGTLIQYLDALGAKSVNYDLGVNYNAANGINTRYHKYLTAVSYVTPTFWGLYSTSKLEYFYLRYPDKSTPRTDNQVGLNFSLSKVLSASSYFGVSLGAVSNSSNIDLNKYSDATIGFQYTKSFAY